jgi:hypothetical protein
MNPLRYIRRSAAALVGLAAAVLVTLGATPAFATIPVPDPGAGYVGPVSDTPPIQVRTIVAGGMPGWQIALIAVGAALLAAALTVLADRAHSARRRAAAVAA